MDFIRFRDDNILSKSLNYKGEGDFYGCLQLLHLSAGLVVLYKIVES